VIEHGRQNRKVAAQAEQIERDLGSIHHILRRPVETAFAKGDLTVPQLAVMRVVVRREGISLKELSREVSLAHSTVSGIVDRLERREMIERKPDPLDGRVSRIVPAERVAEFVKERIPAMTQGPLIRALEKATEAERARIGRALRRLCQLIEEA